MILTFTAIKYCVTNSISSFVNEHIQMCCIQPWIENKGWKPVQISHRFFIGIFDAYWYGIPVCRVK